MLGIKSVLCDKDNEIELCKQLRSSGNIAGKSIKRIFEHKRE